MSSIIGLVLQGSYSPFLPFFSICGALASLFYLFTINGHLSHLLYLLSPVFSKKKMALLPKVLCNYKSVLNIMYMKDPE